MRRLLQSLAALAVAVTGLVVAPTAAHAVTPTQVCSGFTVVDGPLNIVWEHQSRDPEDRIVAGKVYLLRSGNLYCVAVIKTAFIGTASWMSAKLEVNKDSDNDPEVTRIDDGSYSQYAGEECTAPRPADCSTAYGRDPDANWKVRYTGYMVAVSPFIGSDTASKGWMTPPLS